MVIAEEKADGGTAMQVHGTLVEASRDPGTWASAELFSVVTDAAASAWHTVDPGEGKLADQDAAKDRHSSLRECLEAARQQPLFTFGVPESGITQYLSDDPGVAGGYRFARQDGTALAVLLWHDIMHITPGGGIALGFGSFTVHVERIDEDEMGGES